MHLPYTSNAAITEAMKKITSIITAALLATSLVLTGCSSKDSEDKTPADTSDFIKIAVAGPMTGNDSEYGKGFFYAAQLKADEWNENGGVLGKQIEILSYDDKNSSDEADLIAHNIVSEKGIVGVIGHFSSGVCMTAAKTYNENQIIEISPSASHPDYTAVGEYIFRNNTVIDIEAQTAVDIAVNDLGKKSIGLISIKTEWGTNTAGVVQKLVKEMGGDLVAHEEVSEGSDDYSSVVTKLNAAGAQVIIVAGMYNTLAPVAAQYKQINPDIEIVGFSNAYSQNLLDLGGEAVEGIRFPVIFFSESDNPEISDYVERYEKEYGAAPSALTSQAYDSTGMLLEAVKAAGTTDREAVRAKLQELSYSGVTGETKFDENREVSKDFIKVKVQDGNFVPA